MQTALKWIGMTLGLVLVGLVVLVLVFDWNWIKALWSGKRVRRSGARSSLRVILTCSCRGHRWSVWITYVSRMPPGARSPPCSRSNAWLSALTCASCCGARGPPHRRAHRTRPQTGDLRAGAAELDLWT